MKVYCVIIVLLSCTPGALMAANPNQNSKVRIAIVSSYHREYLWSQDTHQGVISALLEFHYLDNPAQIAEFSARDQVESTRAVLLKLWMDTKRENSSDKIKQNIARIVGQLNEFHPDLVLLGDDNATNFIGNQYIDTDTPVVFWGVNGTPLKYGLLDSMERPGHNVTGVYQQGYMKEGLSKLRQLIPEIRRIAILSDDSPSGRSKAKELQRVIQDDNLSIDLIETVVTNDYTTWKSSANRLQRNVDAFFVLNHNTLVDEHGKSVDPLVASAWYLHNIRLPDVSHEKQFVQEGVLCAVDDSGFKQGYEAVQIAHRILHEGKNPAQIPSYAPKPGAFVVNLERAQMLGLYQRMLTSPLVEERLERALALHPIR